MLFLLRVMLVVGGLSYLALMRGGADPAAEAHKIAAAVPRAALPAALPAALAAVPPETRERVVRDVLAKGLMAELSRRAGEPDPAPTSGDTLLAEDRAPAWRGVERR
ncbi:hypothetical protein [Methylobacterium aerolatum]|uniref:Uncharacterized protein n=1 Tax=Methylobacterium aerolatum TaxID=418708 RepID=A0ABU0HYT5_9HYPH|nr:hypothetical protein [Methylobacterium aerolatum]MDQ0447497.1 hypothetical protein [Methylobacterium aerolatum]GJD34598.1 hypothetical protein FMGBMHLM_1500 [Methylobacterium aerolatum]